MKKTLIAIVVMATLIATAYAATRSFTDVSTTDWFYNDVMNMADWDVIRGYPDGTFGPANNVNRAELSAMWNRYDTHVADKINQAVTNISNTGTLGTSVSADNDVATLKFEVGTLHFKYATMETHRASSLFQEMLFNAQFNSLGYNTPIDCSGFDSIKSSASYHLTAAARYIEVTTTDTNTVLGKIDDYKSLCYSI